MIFLWRLRGEIWGYTKFGSPPPRLETLCNMRLARIGGTKLLTVHILGNEMEQTSSANNQSQGTLAISSNTCVHVPPPSMSFCVIS
jgi:hypothetical protein